MLEKWYKAGRAVFTYDGCPYYDMIIPLRCTCNTEVSYSPLVVSVKDRAVSLPDKQKCAKEEMIELFDRTDCPYGAGILLMHGCATGAETKEPLLVTTPKQHQFLFFEIAIPSDDPYGINALINNSVVEGGERAEVYSSHADIYLAGDTPVDTQLRSSKRTNAPEKDVPLQMLSQLRAIVDVTRRKRPLD